MKTSQEDVLTMKEERKKDEKSEIISQCDSPTIPNLLNNDTRNEIAVNVSETGEKTQKSIPGIGKSAVNVKRSSSNPRKSYPASFKLKVIKHAENHGAKSAALKYGLCRSNIRYWKLKEANGVNRGLIRKGKYPLIEKKLADYLKFEVEPTERITNRQLIIKAIQLAKELKMKEGEFIASKNWLRGCLRRQGLIKYSTLKSRPEKEAPLPLHRLPLEEESSQNQFALSLGLCSTLEINNAASRENCYHLEGTKNNLLIDDNIGKIKRVFKRQNYTASFKCKVLVYATRNGFRPAERKFGVCESNIRAWYEQRQLLMNCEQNRKSFRGRKASKEGGGGKFREIEKELSNYVRSKWTATSSITGTDLLNKAREIAIRKNIPNTVFSASYSWLQRSMKRQGIEVYGLKRQVICGKELPRGKKKKPTTENEEFGSEIINLKLNRDFGNLGQDLNSFLGCESEDENERGSTASSENERRSILVRTSEFKEDEKQSFNLLENNIIHKKREETVNNRLLIVNENEEEFLTDEKEGISKVEKTESILKEARKPGRPCKDDRDRSCKLECGRKRGRPRKEVQENVEKVQKRARGRPRKTETFSQSNEIDSKSIINDLKSIKECQKVESKFNRSIIEVYANIINSTTKLKPKIETLFDLATPSRGGGVRQLKKNNAGENTYHLNFEKEEISNKAKRKLIEESLKIKEEMRQSGIFWGKTHIRSKSIRNEENKSNIPDFSKLFSSFKEEEENDYLKELYGKRRDFLCNIFELRFKSNYLIGQIGNVDQTQVYFYSPKEASKIDHQTASSSSSVRVTTSYQKQRMTVVLACLADGFKLPPFIILKSKVLTNRHIKFPSGVVVKGNETGFLTDQEFGNWIGDVWMKRPGAFLKSLLIVDSIKTHLINPQIKYKLNNELKTEHAIIPEGKTFQFQPLNICVEPFKENLSLFYTEWLEEIGLEKMKKEENKIVSLELMVDWILTAWKDIESETVKSAFKKCGISCALDGTENNLIWDLETESFETEEEEESGTDNSESEN